MGSSRNKLISEWSGYITGAARKGALTGKPVIISSVVGVAGPRAGALELLAGMDAGKLLRAFTKDNMASLRQLVPWDFVGSPQCYMAGRYVRVEAGWPTNLAETLIRLGDLGSRPKKGGRWVAGRNEYGGTVIAGLSDKAPHYLVSGSTGSGKSVALQSAILQLSRDPDNRLLLGDGKYGESLNQVSRLRGVIGPVVVDGEGMRAALGWACQEMRKRYQNGNGQGRLIIVIDEIQEFCEDAVVVGLLKKLVAQGRAAGVHCLLATQHPHVSIFGDASIRRNLVGRLTMRVSDSDASRVAVGGSQPRADHLLGCGDSYIIRPGVIHRLQGAFVDDKEIGKAGSGQHLFEEWPEYEAESVGRDLPRSGRPRRSLTHSEIGASLVAAMEGEGRPAFKDRLEAEGLGRPGSDRARTLMTLGRNVKGWLESHDVTLCYLDGNGEEWDIGTD